MFITGCIVEVIEVRSNSVFVKLTHSELHKARGHVEKPYVLSWIPRKSLDFSIYPFVRKANLSVKERKDGFLSQGNIFESASVLVYFKGGLFNFIVKEAKPRIETFDFYSPDNDDDDEWIPF